MKQESHRHQDRPQAASRRLELVWRRRIRQRQRFRPARPAEVDLTKPCATRRAGTTTSFEHLRECAPRKQPGVARTGVADLPAAQGGGPGGRLWWAELHVGAPVHARPSRIRNHGSIETRASCRCGLVPGPIWMLGSAARWPHLGKSDVRSTTAAAKGEVLGHGSTPAAYSRRRAHPGRHGHHGARRRRRLRRLPARPGPRTRSRSASTTRIFFTLPTPRTATRPSGPSTRRAPAAEPGGRRPARRSGVTTSIFPVQMEVDYVPVYQPQRPAPEPSRTCASAAS